MMARDPVLPATLGQDKLNLGNEYLLSLGTAYLAWSELRQAWKEQMEEPLRSVYGITTPCPGRAWG